MCQSGRVKSCVCLILRVRVCRKDVSAVDVPVLASETLVGLIGQKQLHFPDNNRYYVKNRYSFWEKVVGDRYTCADVGRSPVQSRFDQSDGRIGAYGGPRVKRKPTVPAIVVKVARYTCLSRLPFYFRQEKVWIRSLNLAFVDADRIG